MARPGVVVVGEAVPDAVEAAEASELYPVMVLDVGRCQLMRRLRPVEERNDGVYADTTVLDETTADGTAVKRAVSFRAWEVSGYPHLCTSPHPSAPLCTPLHPSAPVRTSSHSSAPLPQGPLLWDARHKEPEKLWLGRRPDDLRSIAATIVTFHPHDASSWKAAQRCARPSPNLKPSPNA